MGKMRGLPEEQGRNENPKYVIQEGEREESCTCLKVLELYKGNYVYAKEDGHDILEGNSVDAVASGEPNGGQGKREERGDDKPDRSLFVDDWHMNFLLQRGRHTFNGR